MTGKDLFEGMTWVDEGFIDEAEHAAFPKPRVVPWIRIASMAACLCLILLGLYHFRSNPNRGTPDGQNSLAQGGIEDNIEDIVDQNSQINAPADGAIAEIPNVILYVEEMTAEGFIGTVTDFGVTDHLGLGTRLNVVIGEGTRSDSDNTAVHDYKTDFTGRYVVFQFYEYDPDTGTIVIESYDIIDEE